MSWLGNLRSAVQSQASVLNGMQQYNPNNAATQGISAAPIQNRTISGAQIAAGTIGATTSAAVYLERAKATFLEMEQSPDFASIELRELRIFFEEDDEFPEMLPFILRKVSRQVVDAMFATSTPANQTRMMQQLFNRLTSNCVSYLASV